MGCCGMIVCVEYRQLVALSGYPGVPVLRRCARRNRASDVDIVVGREESSRRRIPQSQSELQDDLSCMQIDCFERIHWRCIAAEENSRIDDESSSSQDTQMHSHVMATFPLGPGCFYPIEQGRAAMPPNRRMECRGCAHK